MVWVIPVLVTGNDGVSKQATVAGVESGMGMTARLSVDAHDKRVGLSNEMLRSHSIFFFRFHSGRPERVLKSI